MPALLAPLIAPFVKWGVIILAVLGVFFYSKRLLTKAASLDTYKRALDVAQEDKRLAATIRSMPDATLDDQLRASRARRQR